MKKKLLLLLIAMLLSAGCNFPSAAEPAATTKTDTILPVVPLPTAAVTSADAPKPAMTETQVTLPTSVQISPSVPTVAETPGNQTVLIYLVALEDNGISGEKIGCGDSLVPVSIGIPRTQGVLRAAIEELLSVEDAYYGESGLYNALYQSNLQAREIRIEDGQAIIQLEGALRLGGVCDNPRVEGQLKQTALQFSTVRDVAITVNGTPLEDLLSGK